MKVKIENLELSISIGEHSRAHSKGYGDGYAKGLADGKREGRALSNES